MKIFTVILLSIFTLFCNAQKDTDYLTKSEIENDLKILDGILKNQSSYQGLNGFDYRKDFDNYLDQLDGTKITKSGFGLFLSKTIGKIGDRHSYIKGYDLPETLYFPLSFAPFKGKVLVLEYDKANKEYAFWNSEFPYLKSINNIPLDQILPKIIPSEQLAPKSSYSLLAIRDLRDIETVFSILNINFNLPNTLPVTLTNENGIEKVVDIKLVSDENKAYLWDERFHKKNFFLREEQLNDIEIIQQFFTIKDNIGYIQIVDMLSIDDSPVFFEYLNDFMIKAKETDALIIDVRDNGGGTRDLIQELAGYFVDPNSVYVVNATRQRGKLPLNDELKKELHNRFLFSRDELDRREQNTVDKFMTSFEPMYNLDNDKFSEYYYYIFNGQKITKDKYHYDKPICILTNERSFSAASILVSTFKGLPNIKIVGVNTDGSSGNSQRFELPNSELRGKISTMVSFQKNGKILDGIGTAPDIKIERNLDQIFLKEDHQLNRLLEILRME
ncbi:peptidase S41 family protein [Psychroflexus torquis ATCC 700755]|uniref:Peptidase S41 family protein n=1 Tax=Psychroflexus torquis (strain ATCC 700755 / CIP 106069 / ACAM 623) TaxID=313595 RepID=K4IDX7_PSYTT|nr:S41 family peptidase [Psychroflexus torquis]AFU68599.1 peptidase S41 family protein [Psychroflexus torquis ATCC 700755]